jgi:hypothetical protein
MWVQLPASPKNLTEKDGQLDGRKNNKNYKVSQMGQSYSKKAIIKKPNC